MIYNGILMREDIFVFGRSSHDAAIEITLCFTFAVYFIAAALFFPAFYGGRQKLTIASGGLCAVCSFVFLLFAANSTENIVSFVDASSGNSFDANLTPEDEQLMLAFHQMCCFITFGHSLLMHGLLWNIVYSKTEPKDLLSVPKPGSAK